MEFMFMHSSWQHDELNELAALVKIGFTELQCKDKPIINLFSRLICLQA